MNTKMILEIAGAKPLAASHNTIAEAKGLVAEKGGRGVSKNLEISGKIAGSKKSFRDCEGAYGSEGGKEAAVGLGEGMWRGVFG